MAMGLAVLRRAPPLLLLGGRAPLRRLGSGAGARWSPQGRGWGLGTGLGLALAAAAVAAAAEDDGEKAAAGFARAVGSSRELLQRVKVGVAPGWAARGPLSMCRISPSRDSKLRSS